MSEIINQCCYTHKGAWTAVAQKGNFDQKYIGELSRHATLPGPEYGTDLAVFETVGDGDVFLIMRTQYGLRDLSTESGRASMFSHGYLLDTSGATFDPNVFLTVSEDNFCTDELDASKNRISLKRTENFTLKTAMAVSGLTMESFSKLIKCVYQLSVRSVNKQALFIRAKDNMQSLALLYCIYSALIPRYSRYLSSSSVEYNFSDMRNIVFAKSVNASRKYFIPETGENNVLSVNVEKNIDSLYFVDYGVKNFSTTEAIQEYYSEFEKTLKKISDAKQVADDVIRLAHVMTADPIPSKDSDVVSDDDALMSVLKFATEYNIEKDNIYIKEYIEKLRAEAIRRGLIKVEPPKPVITEVTPIDDVSYEDIGNMSEPSVGSTSSPTNGFRGGGIPFNRGASTTKTPEVSVAYSERLNAQRPSTEYNTFGNDYSAGTANRHRESATIRSGQNAPVYFSDIEIKKFERDLQRNAQHGVMGFVEFSRLTEQAIKRICYISDESLRRDIAKIIYKNFCDLLAVSVKDTQRAFSDNPLIQFEKWFNELGYNNVDILKSRAAIITKYWDAFQWQKFSVAKVSDYSYFAIDSDVRVLFLTKNALVVEKADSVNGIVKLVTCNKDTKAEDWLWELHGVSGNISMSSADFQRLRDVMLGFYRKNIAIRRQANDIFSDEFCAQYIVTSAMYFQKVEFEKYVQTWQLIYLFLKSAINKREAKDAADIAEAIEDITSMTYAAVGNKKYVFTSTMNFFIELERRHIQVPFDFWLALGSYDKEHPFQVFYSEYEPMVKESSPSEIVATSFLLKDDTYVNLLNEAAKETKDKFIKNLVKAISGDDDSGLGGKFKNIFGRKK